MLLIMAYRADNLAGTSRGIGDLAVHAVLPRGKVRDPGVRDLANADNQAALGAGKEWPGVDQQPEAEPHAVLKVSCLQVRRIGRRRVERPERTAGTSRRLAEV